MEGLKKSTKEVSQNIGWHCRDSNDVLPKWKLSEIPLDSTSCRFVTNYVQRVIIIFLSIRIRRWSC